MQLLKKIKIIRIIKINVLHLLNKKKVMDDKKNEKLTFSGECEIKKATVINHLRHTLQQLSTEQTSHLNRLQDKLGKIDYFGLIVRDSVEKVEDDTLVGFLNTLILDLEFNNEIINEVNKKLNQLL